MSDPLTTSPTPLKDRKIVTPPFWIVAVFLVLVVVSWIPLVVIARARVSKSPEPRIHIFQDMDEQPRYEAQGSSPVFADHRAMRPRIVGTVRQDVPLEEEHLHQGYRIDGFDDAAKKYNVTYFPDFPQQIQFTREFIERGQNRFEIYCLPCHGADGAGDGPVNRRALELGGSWIKASNLHDQIIRERMAGHLYNTIAQGIRSMPGYAQQIQDPADRWAIVAYVRALQLSQNAPAATVDTGAAQPSLATGN